FTSGVITNLTSGESYQAEPFPEFMQELIAAGGLLNYLKNR
ncbi:MAG: 3-isopropylmalate dehydratase small subunit, partial [Limnochordia bacterium]